MKSFVVFGVLNRHGCWDAWKKSQNENEITLIFIRTIL